jgi:hypothetical protein
MTLDITQVYSQIEAMAGDLKSHQSDYAQKLELALATLKSIPPQQDRLKKKIEDARATWLVAGLKEDVSLHRAAAPCPDDFMVVASDGSHIDVDRHQSTRLFLLNIGLVELQYGSKPDAQLSSLPTLYFGDEMLTIRSRDGRQELIEGPLVGIKRQAEECRSLADRICSVEATFPIVGLLDGSLIMWRPEDKHYDFVVEKFLHEGFLNLFDRFYELNHKKKAVIASYISFPRYTDVVNALRLQICPYDPVDCKKHCEGKFEGRECDVVGGLTDRAVFDRLLSSGERSSLFSSRSLIIKRYGIHQVCFFYLKLDEEVARVEVPLWVADNNELLDLVHAVTLDQCHKGFGYPVSLSEAHEQAVVTGADRQQFWDLVDRVMQNGGMAVQQSLKQRSKKAKCL